MARFIKHLEPLSEKGAIEMEGGANCVGNLPRSLLAVHFSPALRGGQGADLC